MSTLDTALCCLSSAAAGIGAAFFGCVLSWANHEKEKNGMQHTRKSGRVAIAGAIGSTIFGFSSLVGLYFGPVTLVVVIRAGSLLPANALFSQLFKLRPLTRDDYLGTLVTISGVLCFSIFGGSPAAAPKTHEFLEMMVTTSAWVCNILLISIFFLSGLVLLLPHDDELLTAFAITIIGGVSSAFMDLAAKGWSAALNKGVDTIWGSGLFWTALAINVLFLISMRVSMIYGCKRCDVLLFVPLNTVLNIFFSVVVGMVVLQEFKQVTSWPGLLGASTSVLGGVVLLVTGPAVGHHHEQKDAGMWADGECEEDYDDLEVVMSTSRKTSRKPSTVSDRKGSMDMQRSRTDGGGFDPSTASGLSDPLPERKSDSDLRPVPDPGHTIGDLLQTIQYGLRPEMVQLNGRQVEAFQMRRRWDLLKSRVRQLVPLENLRILPLGRTRVATPGADDDDDYDFDDADDDDEDSSDLSDSSHE